MIVASLVATLFVAPKRARAQQTEDKWWAPDKALHFGVAAAIAGIGYGVGTEIFEKRWACAALGGGLAIGAGAGKELLDMTGAGDPSWKDFTWDVIGAVAGLGIAIAIDAIVRSHDDSTSTASGSHSAALSNRFAPPSAFALQF